MVPLEFADQLFVFCPAGRDQDATTLKKFLNRILGMSYRLQEIYNAM